MDPLPDKSNELEVILGSAPVDPLALASVPKKKVSKVIEKSVLEIKAQENIGRDTILGAAAKFGEVIEKCLTNFEADRVEQNEVITHLKEMVINQPKVKGFYVDNLVGALKVKSETNSNITKILDSIAKLITAGKGELFIKKTDTSFADIAKLLQEGQ